MNNQIAAQLYLDIKNGKETSNKRKQFLIGYLESIKEKHKKNQKYEELNQVQKILDDLKNKNKKLL